MFNAKTEYLLSEKIMEQFKNYINQNLKQLDTNGIIFDETINVLTGGEAGQTVSLRAAIGAGYTPEGRVGPRKLRWCIFCAFLAKAVQPNHCALQFIAGKSNWRTWVRAMITFAIGICGIILIAQYIIHIAIKLL
jgi:hypothetical protein